MTDHCKKREQITKEIVSSKHAKKIIIAGPGTGKTHLFKEICKTREGDKLVLSFINELVDDLSADLSEFAEVKTLHGYARSAIRGNTNIFIRLPEIISEDYFYQFGEEIDFYEALSNPDKYEEELKFYIDRARYYGYFCPSSLIYGLIKIYSADKSKIKEYSQIMVDEFQDFNPLEIKLVDLLSEKNPVLLVGDDDQSLYSWKYSSPHEIRSRASDPNYEFHELPYCSRCTKVLVSAVNNFINTATQKGFLKNRKSKPFKYFPCEEKDRVSKENPKIILHLGVNRVAAAHYLNMDLKNRFSATGSQEILVVCSSKSQIPDLTNRLRDKGLCRVKVNIKIKDDLVIEGMKLLLDNSKDRLGWRILSGRTLTKKQLSKAVKASAQSAGEYTDYLTVEQRKEIKSVLTKNQESLSWSGFRFR